MLLVKLNERQHLIYDILISILAVICVILIFVGYLLYHEAITWNKIAGIIICVAGLVLINLR